MNLIKYDNKCVRIICIDGKTYEGNCQYNSKDYCLHEFGRNEESLDIFHFMFYKKDIKKITIIDKFTEKYGEIEKATCKDMDLLEQALDSDEDDIHVYRLLLCLEDNKITPEIVKMLNQLIKYSENKKIVNKASEIIQKGKK